MFGVVGGVKRRTRNTAREKDDGVGLADGDDALLELPEDICR